MQTNKTLMRLIAVVMTVVMMLTAIPFTSLAAADESADYVAFGTFDSKEILWRVLEKKADGSLVLITKDTVLSGLIAYGTKYDYAESTLKSTVDSAIILTDTESACLTDTTMSYMANGKTQQTLATKFAIPTKADFEAYSLKKASAVYFLADTGSAAASKINYVDASGALKTANATRIKANIRIMVTVKADCYAALPTVEGLTYTTVNGTSVNYALTGTQVKLNLADAYNQSDVVVKFGETEATGADGVYTIGTGAMTVEGVKVNPADYEAYNAAVAKTEGLKAEHYEEDTWKPLAEALATDVSGLTAADQDKIDAATKAIETALKNLKAYPADLEAYQAAVAAARALMKDSDRNIKAKPQGQTDTYEVLFTLALAKEKNLLKATIDKQAEVDAATKELNDLCAQVPYYNASISNWVAAKNEAYGLDAEKYDAAYIAEVAAKVDAIVAENDYEALFNAGKLDIRDQGAIDASTAKIKAAYADKDSHFIQTDFSKLAEALERAKSYEETNYYKDEDVKRKEEQGGTLAWDTFASRKAAAENYFNNQNKYTQAFAYQADIDTAVTLLTESMDTLDGFIKLGKWDRFVKDVQWFFYDVKYEIDGIIALLKTVAGLLGMLFRGEIDLYGLFEMLDVGEDVLNFLIKIGITPKEDIDVVDPENPDAPEATA